MVSNRKCICCGEKYQYCPSCGNDRLKETWYSAFCSETCKDLWQTLSKYSMGFINKSQAIELINTLPLKDKSKYVACVQRDLGKLFEKEVKRNKSVKEQVIIEKLEIENISTQDTNKLISELNQNTHEVVKTENNK